MADSKTKSEKCIKCEVDFRKISIKGRKIIKNENDIKEYGKVLDKILKIGDILCSKCRSSVSFKLSAANKASEGEGISDTAQSASSSSKTAYDSLKNDADYLKKVNYADKNSDAYEAFLELPNLTPTPPSTQSSGSIYLSPAVKDVTETVEMPFKRVAITHRRCCVCQKYFDENATTTVVPIEARIQAFVSLKIYINKGNRCCSHHILKKRFISNELISTY